MLSTHKHSSLTLLDVENTKLASPLNKRFTCSPAETLASHQRYKMLWTAAKVTAISLFLIGAIGGAIALSILNPGALFFFAVGFATGIQVLAMLTSWFDKKISYHANETERYTRITQIFEDLMSKDDYDLDWEFRSNDASSWSIQGFDNVEGGLKTLTSGLAHLIYSNESTESLNRAMVQLRNRLDEETDPEKTRSAARKVFCYEQAAVLSRLHAAYDLHLLLNPFSHQQLSDIGTIVDRNIEEVLLDRYFTKENNMFCFKDASKDPITFDDLKDETLYSLQSRF